MINHSLKLLFFRQNKLGSSASNPAKIPFDFIQFISSNKRVLLSQLVTLVIGCLLGFWGHKLFFILLFVYLFSILCHYLWINDVYIIGDLNPALVVENAGEKKLFTMTDMKKLYGNYPVVAVFKVDFPEKVEYNSNKTGVVLMYGGDKFHLWQYFMAHPIMFATKNEFVLQEKMNKFSSSEWQELERRIRQLPKNPEYGIYKVDVDTTDWKKNDDVKLEGGIYRDIGLMYRFLLLRKYLSSYFAG